MNELSQPLFQLHAPFIVLTAKSSIEVQASITYAFVSACTDSIIISIPRGTDYLQATPIKGIMRG